MTSDSEPDHGWCQTNKMQLDAGELTFASTSANTLDAHGGLREAYARKLAQVNLAPCAHIVSILGEQGASKGAPGGFFEHHAVLDVSAREVIHYSRLEDNECNSVRVDSLEVFEESFPTWRIVNLPSSVEHAQQVLERARSKVGEREYSLVSNNCEHFASWCFEGSASSKQVWTMGFNVATSAKGGMVAGLGAAAMTTTITKPVYLLWFIPWGSSSVTVPAMSAAAATGVGAAVFVGWVGVSLVGSFGFNKWVDVRNREINQSVPIAVFNSSETEVIFQLKNLESSSSYYSSNVDDFVHDTRAFCGVGQRQLTLGSYLAGELNPPAEDELFSKFSLVVLVKRQAQSFISSYLWSNYQEVARCEVKRGDVIIYRDGALSVVADPKELVSKSAVCRFF